jgi:hypothetical protein
VVVAWVESYDESSPGTRRVDRIEIEYSRFVGPRHTATNCKASRYITQDTFCHFSPCPPHSTNTSSHGQLLFALHHGSALRAGVPRLLPAVLLFLQIPQVVASNEGTFEALRNVVFAWGRSLLSQQRPTAPVYQPIRRLVACCDQ